MKGKDIGKTWNSGDKTYNFSPLFSDITNGIVFTITDSRPDNVEASHIGHCNADGVWKYGAASGDYSIEKTIKGGIITCEYTDNLPTTQGLIRVVNTEPPTPKATLKITGGTIAGFISSAMGGVLKVYSGDFIMEDGAFYGNSTEGTTSKDGTKIFKSQGGTIMDVKDSIIEIKGGTFENNVYYDSWDSDRHGACDGGVIIRVNGHGVDNTIKISGGTFIGNKIIQQIGIDTKKNSNSPGKGALIFIWGNADSLGKYENKVIIEGNVTIKNNSAPLGGVVGMNIQKSNAYLGKLALEIKSNENGTPLIQNNTATNTVHNNSGLGGVLYMAVPTDYSGDIKPTLTVDIDGGKIIDNKAEKSGGVIYMATEKANPNTSGVTLNSVEMKNNNAEVDGGAIYLEYGNIAVSGNTTIESNTAKGNGGAVYFKNGTMTIKDNIMIGSNTAKTDGGAIYMASGTMNITGGTSGSSTDCVNISSNTATDGNGGGIYLKGDSKTTLSISGRTNIIANKAPNGFGGGIYQEAGTFSAVDTTVISANEAVKGAGIYVSNGTMTIGGDSTISGNTSTDNGGGVFLNNGTMNIIGKTQVLSNSSKDKGAGIYMESGSLNLNGDGLITGNTLTNTTTGQGSGFYLKDAKAVTLGKSMSFGGDDEFYIYSLANCKEGETNVGIKTDFWTGTILKLGLDNANFGTDPKKNVVIMTVDSDKGSKETQTLAGDIAGRIRLTDEEKYVLKNIKVIDWDIGKKESDDYHVYAALHTPSLVDVTFIEILKDAGSNPLTGTLAADFVISDDNTTDWYVLELYYMSDDEHKKEEPTWTLVQGIPGTGTQVHIDEVQKRENYTIEGLRFDTEHHLENGYYGIRLKLGKTSVHDTLGSVSPILERLHLVAYAPIIPREGQPAHFVPLRVGQELTEEQKLTVNATDFTGNPKGVSFSWEYCTTGDPNDFKTLNPAVVAGADTNSIYPTEDGSSVATKVMDGYYRCKVTNLTPPANATNDGDYAAVLYSSVSQVATEYEIHYLIASTGEEIDKFDETYYYYDKLGPKTLPDTTYVETKVPGYLFYGWYEDEGLTKLIGTIPKDTTGSKTFYGDIILIPYFIKLDVNGKGVWSDTETTEQRGGQKGTSDSLFVNVGTASLPLLATSEYTVKSVGKRADVTTFDGWSVGPERYSPIVIYPDGTVVPDVVVGDRRYTTENGEWLYAPDSKKSVDITLYAHWVWPDPVVYLESLGGQPVELNKVKVEVTNENGDKFVYKSPKNDPGVGDFLEAGEKLNLAYGVDPVNGLFPEYDDWGVGHGEKVRVHVIYNNEHTLYDQEVIAI